MPPQTSDEDPQDILSVAVLGSDTVLAALPAHPIQLTHACHQLGFDAVVPLSWGDELIAEHVLRELKTRGRLPAVVCSCERVRTRLLASGVALAQFLVPTVTPAVAAGRYLRSLYEGRRIRLTFIGSCEGGADEVFDAQITPTNLLELLLRAGIDVLAQPAHFTAVVPPDRRRYASLPNGCPSSEVLRDRGLQRRLAEIETGDFVQQLAECLLAHDPVLVDVAPALGCACAGAGGMVASSSARIAVMSLEPPRALSSPLVLNPGVDVSQSVSPRPVRRTAPIIVQGEPDVEVTALALQPQAADLPSPAPVLVRRPPAVTPPHVLAAMQSSPFRASSVRVAKAPRVASPVEAPGASLARAPSAPEPAGPQHAPFTVPPASPEPLGTPSFASGDDERSATQFAHSRPAPSVRRVPPPQAGNRTALYLGCLAVALAIASAIGVFLRYR